jgi:hypothetical protein
VRGGHHEPRVAIEHPAAPEPGAPAAAPRLDPHGRGRDVRDDLRDPVVVALPGQRAGEREGDDPGDRRSGDRERGVRQPPPAPRARVDEPSDHGPRRSLDLRARPHGLGDRHAGRRGRLREHRDPDAADADLLAAAQRDVARRLAVDERPVGRAEVAQPQAAVLRRQLGVAARGAGVADHEVGAGDAAEHERAVDLHHATGVLAGEDLEPHAGVLSRRRRRRPAACAA